MNQNSSLTQGKKLTEIFILSKKNFRQHQQKLANFTAIVWVCIEMNRMFQVPKGDSFPQASVESLNWRHCTSFLSLLDTHQCVRYTDHQFSNSTQDHCLLKKMTFLDSQEPEGWLWSAPLCAILFSQLCSSGSLWSTETLDHQGQQPALSYILLTLLFLGFLCSYSPSALPTQVPA